MRLSIGGRTISHSQATSAFSGDIRRSTEMAATTGIDAHERLRAARRLLSEDENWRAVVRLTKYAAYVDVRHLPVGQLLSHPHRKELVAHLAGQPQLCVMVADTSVAMVRSLLPCNDRKMIGLE
jgi:hypothetical protein